MKTSLLLPHQSLFLQAPLLFPQLRFFLLVCGYGCVRGNTLLDTPKGKVAIKDFKGGLLYSWDGSKVVEAFALPSVKTSAKKMYRIEFTDSSFIVCPQSHQLLTRGGYKDVRSVFYTISLSSTSFSSRLRSIEESSPLGSPSSVPRLIHKGVGLIYRCLLYFRRCGVPLLFLKEAYRELFPLPHDEASCSSYQDEQEYTRLYHASSFFGRFYSFLHSPVKVFESLLFVRTSGAISQEGQEAALSAASKAHSHRGLLSSLFSLFSDCIKPLTVLFSKEYSFIRSISYVGEYEKWDLHVPTYNNYISQGLIHHNSGKTNALAKNILYHAIQLQGKKDADNRSPRLLLAGITMSHLEKTTVLFLKQDLDASCTPYRHDKKHNMITIGSVIIILASIVDYASLTGFDVHASFVDEADDASGADNKGDITYEAIKAVNERTRQRIKGCRNPFVQIACVTGNTRVITKCGNKKIKDITTNDVVQTRYGYRKVLLQSQTGVRKVICRNGIFCTPEHLFATENNTWTQAKDLDKSSSVMVYSDTRSSKWKETSMGSLLSLTNATMSILTECATIGGTQRKRSKGTIQRILRKAKKELSCIERYGYRIGVKYQKGVSYIISTLTQEIMILETCLAFQKKNTMPCTEEINTFLASVLTVLRPLIQGESVNIDVYPVRGKEEKSKIMSVTKQFMPVCIQVCGKKRLLKSAVLCVGKVFYRLVSHVRCVLNATKKREQKGVGKCHIIKQGISNNIPIHAGVSSAVNSTLLLESLQLALKNVETNCVQELVLIPQELFLPTQYAPVARIIDAVINLLLIFAPPVPVFDITVDVPPSCEGEFVVKSSSGVTQVLHNSTSQGTEGLYHVYVDFIANKMAFLLIRGKTRDNFYLGEDYISSMEKTYTETERKVYMEGEFLALSSGKVFSDFDWDKNYISSSIDKTVIASETIYFSLDINSGYNRGCIGIIRDSKIFIIKRYEFKNLRDAPSVVRYEFPHNKILWLPDNSAKDTIVTLKREMMKFNIFWILRSKNPSREDSVFAVNKLLYTQRLIFTRLAQETAKAIEGLQRDKNNAIPQGKAPSSYVHDCDAVRMMVYFILCTKSEFVDIARVTIARHREIFDEDSPPPAIQSLNAGYSLIPASTIPD